MSIMVRCECGTFNNKTLSKCKKCGNKFKQGDKLYYIVVKNKNKQVWKKAGYSITHAKELEKKVQAELILNPEKFESKEESQLKEITFKKFVEDYYIPHYQIKNKSFWIEKYKIYEIINALGKKKLEKITTLDIEKFLGTLQKRNLSSCTIDKYIMRIKAIFNYAIQVEALTKNPVKQKQKKVSKEMNRFLSKEEEKRLLEACKQSDNPDLYDIVMIALYTGLRPINILNMSNKNISADLNYIEFQKENIKSKRKVIIPIHPKIKDIIIKRVGKKEKWFPYKSVKRSFDTAKKRAGIKDFRMYDLRHTFASRLVQKGVSLYVVQQLLGHSDSSMTQRYAHLSNGVFEDALLKI